jgi:uncharacterized protein (TIGR03435 family)
MSRYALILFVPVAILAQSATQDGAFEVASIKLHEGPLSRSGSGVVTSGVTLNAYADNIRGLVMFAYKVDNFQVDGTAPLFNDSEARWDIVAKAEGSTALTRDEFRPMVRLLLAERFHLKVRREMRPTPVYALVVDKDGPKLKEADPDANPTQHYGGKGPEHVFTLPKAGMVDLVDAVSNARLDRPVVDGTGLSGVYNIKLTYTEDSGTEPGVAGVDVFQALKEQLGLKLEKRTVPVEFLVVEKVEKPWGN